MMGSEPFEVYVNGIHHGTAEQKDPQPLFVQVFSERQQEHDADKIVENEPVAGKK
jgi:hypothetical protein